MTSRQCQDSYFLQTGVVKQTQTAGGQVKTQVDLLHTDWLSWWMCRCPECTGLSQVAWLLLGAAIQAGYAKYLHRCDGKTCGDDGYGASCGTCPGQQDACVQGKCLCQPFCESPLWPGQSPCGDDGCGGSCGSCVGEAAQCIQFPSGGSMCFCDPECGGRECGTDGCGGSCGSCPGSQEACIDGRCTCIPNCEGRACGDDGCGGSCGTCAEAQATCFEGSCVCPYGDDVQLCGSCVPLQRWTAYSTLIAQLNLYALVGMSTEQADRLKTAIIELECGQTAHWSDYDALDSLSYDQMQNVWLRRVAVCLRNEIDHVFGYSLLALSSLNLQRLLCNPAKSATERIFGDLGVASIDASVPLAMVDIWDDSATTKELVEWNNKFIPDFGFSAFNPLDVLALAMEMMVGYHPSNSVKMVCDELIDSFYHGNWVHYGTANPDIGGTLADLAETKVFMGCKQLAGLFWHLLRMCNIPAMIGNEMVADSGTVLDSGHAWIRIIDLDCCCHADSLATSKLPGTQKMMYRNWFIEHSNGTSCEFWTDWGLHLFSSRFYIWLQSYSHFASAFADDVFELSKIGPSGLKATEFSSRLLTPSPTCLCSIGSFCGCENRGIGFHTDVRAKLKAVLQELGLPVDTWENILAMVCDGTLEGCLDSDYFMTDEASNKMASCKNELCCPLEQPWCENPECLDWSYPICRKRWCDGTL